MARLAYLRDENAVPAPPHRRPDATAVTDEQADHTASVAAVELRDVVKVYTTLRPPSPVFR